ncbi:MAG: response regulator transcription factor [Methyloversatilis discipulorum]|uniref:response regulator transcription factor n=1 Tax=Methyloversatilis discipulorum TaxID=1119528 RepID=UPI0026E9D927|nr:response regulator transcription factor [Methyloversatilis discipulorum]MBT9518680.1 response regulator transcription factor [Methyloversatilis discipulorum]
MIRLLLVDDHAVVREGYRRLLERRADLRIEAEAASANEALTAFRTVQPDVVILDLGLPDMGGVELVRRLMQREARARILVFSMHRDPLFASQALRAGALGYVTKSCAPDVLIDAVYQVAARRRVLSPDIAPELALALLNDADNPLDALSPREFEVLRMLLDGRSADEIGQALHISPKTAQNTHYQIKAKLGTRTDIDLVRLAMKWGLGASEGAGDA